MKNVGSIDRAIRIVGGLLLVILPFASNISLFDAGFYKYTSLVIGLVFIGTALVQFCPIYRIFGIRS